MSLRAIRISVILAGLTVVGACGGAPGAPSASPTPAPPAPAVFQTSDVIWSAARLDVEPLR